MAAEPGVPARWMAHKVFIVAAAWMLIRLTNWGMPTAAGSLADLAVLAVGLGSAFLVRTPHSRLWYLYFVHVGLLGWLDPKLATVYGFHAPNDVERQRASSSVSSGSSSPP